MLARIQIVCVRTNLQPRWLFLFGLLNLLMVSVSWAADAIPGERYCIRSIDKITYHGNHITKRKVIARELRQEIHSPCSIDDIVDSIQSLMDLGLFKSVWAELVYANDLLELQMHVEEKFYYFALPRLSRTSDAELRAGVQVRADNFLGRLHLVELTFERRQQEDGDGNLSYVNRLDYVIPRIFSSNFGFALNIGSNRRQVDLKLDNQFFGTAQSDSRLFSAQVSRWINESNGIQGLRVFAGFRYEQREFSDISDGTGPFSDGTDVALFIGAEDKQVHNDLFRRRGYVYGGQITMANASTASDFAYTRADFYAARYIALNGGIRNLNVQARLGISDGAAFGERSYQIGGGEQLRGMETDYKSGNVMTLFNVEYLNALYARPQWRWLLFADMGNVYKRDKVKLLQQKTRAGVGLRYKVQSISNTDLRLDVAWDPSLNKAKLYVSSNLTF